VFFALWGLLFAIGEGLFEHGIYGAVLDWLREHFASQIATVIAYVSAHALLAIGAGLICVLAYFLGALHHSTAERPAPGRTLSTEQTEKAIRQKADAEFDIAKRELWASPFPDAQLVRLEDNIRSNYAPLTVLTRAFNIRIESQIIPLLDLVIRKETELRIQNKVPFTRDRIDHLRNRFRNFVTEQLPYIVDASYMDAEKHVNEQYGKLQDYKAKELYDARIGLIEKEPKELFAIFDEKLQKAMAESTLVASNPTDRPAT
jgi:hypothetical protein